MASRRSLLALGGIAAAIGGIALVRRGRKFAAGRHEEGGIVMADPAATDNLSGFFLRPMYVKVAAEIAAAAPSGGAVLDIGCGPGHLPILLSGRHGLDVTGLDLDADMIELAEKNASRLADPATRPAFVVGSVDALPFDDASFDVVVSTLSLHHWADRETGLREIHRVLRPGGRALIWDFRSGAHVMGHHMPDVLALAVASPFANASVTPWRWPWRLSLLAKTELVRDGAEAV